MKLLTKKQKTVEVQRSIKNIIKNIIEPKMLNEVSEMINDKNLPDEYLIQGNNEVHEFILKNNLKTDKK